MGSERARTLLHELGLAATAVDLGETVRPPIGSASEEPIAAARIPVSVGSLPHLSLDLGAAAPIAPGAATAASGDIVVEEVLGEGGMGRVFLAAQRSLGRKVALKTVRDPADRQQVAALLAEGAVAGSLDHPHVLPVHLLGFDVSGRPVLVMKRIVGASWADLLADPAHPLWEQALFLDPAGGGRGGAEPDRLVAHLRILMLVAEAIHFAHQRGVVHRDIKPENVMIGESSEVYVVDWGIAARLGGELRPGLVGTPQFLAPEMATGDHLGPETDVYLLGATLHAILTGRPRHDGSTLLAVLQSALASEPVAYAPEVPDALAAIANEATRRAPRDRIPTAAAFRMRLADFLAHRVARALCAAASERVAELAALRAAGRIDDPRANQLAAEARFGLEQALRDQPDDPRAMATRELLLEELLRLELDRRNLPAARAWLGQLAAPSPELAAKIDALAVELDTAERERERLAKLADDLDPTFMRRVSAWVAVGAVAYGAGVSGSIHAGLLGTVTPATLLGISTLLLAISLVGIGLMRRLVLRNKIGRQLTLGLLFMVLVFWAHRFGGWLADTPPHETLRSDLFILATGALCLGAVGSRRWIVAGAVIAAGGLAASLAPTSATHAFTGATTLAMLLVSLELRAPR